MFYLLLGYQLQWRSWLAHGTYTTVFHVIQVIITCWNIGNAEVASSSLAWSINLNYLKFIQSQIFIF